MRLRNYCSLFYRLGWLFGLMIILSLTALMAKAQGDVFSTNSYNAEVKRIDDQFHDCTRRNRGNHQGIQDCINTAREAKQQLAMKRQNSENQRIANRQEGRINQDVILTNGKNSKPNDDKPYYPPYPDFKQTPKSAPQPKRKTIKSGTNANQNPTNSNSKPKLIRTDVWIGEGEIKYKFWSSSEQRWIETKLPYQITLRDYFYSDGTIDYAAEGGEISKNSLIPQTDGPIVARIVGTRNRNFPSKLQVTGVYVKNGGMLTPEFAENLVSVKQSKTLRKIN